MLSVLRAQSQPPHIRSYAKLLSIAHPSRLPKGKTPISTPTSTALERAGRIDVDPHHGLWHFFRRKEVDGKIEYETVEPVEDALRVTGRSWTAAELRRKSFSDLHTLWYVVLREQNLLATQKEEARRLAVPATNSAFFTSSKLFRCRKTMARIKCVLNERRLAYEGALRLLAEQKAEAESKSDSAPSSEQQPTSTAGLTKLPDRGRKAKKFRAVTPRKRGARESNRESILENEGADAQAGKGKAEGSTTVSTAQSASAASASELAAESMSKDIHP